MSPSAGASSPHVRWRQELLLLCPVWWGLGGFRMWRLSWAVAGFGGGSGLWLSRALRPPPKVGGRTVRLGARSRLRPRRAVVAQAPRPPVGWRSRRRSLGRWWEPPHTERGFFVGGAESWIEVGGMRPLPKALGGFLTFSHSARQPPDNRPYNVRTSL